MMKMTKGLLCAALTLSLLVGMFAISGLSASASTTWDYEHTMSQTYEAWDLSKFTAYQFAKPAVNAPVVANGGPYVPSAKDEAYTAATRAHWASSYYGAHCNGVLKATTMNAWAALTYAAASMKDFELEFTIPYAYARQGLIIGGKPGMMPVSADSDPSNDTGIVLAFESGKFYAGGALAEDTANYSELPNMNVAELDITARSNNVAVSSSVSAETMNTYHVKVENGVLTMWSEGEDSLKKEIQLSDNYKGGYISYFSASNQCGLWSLKIKKLSDVEQGWDYEHTMSARYEAWPLDAYFSAYEYAKPVSTSSAEATAGPIVPSTMDTYNDTPTRAWWSTSDWGTHTKGWLRPTNTRGWAVLTYKVKAMEEMEFEFTVAPSYARQGMVIGGAGNLGFTRDSDNTNDTGIAIGIESAGTLVVGGAIDATASVALGSCTLSTHGDFSGMALVAKTFTGTYSNNVTAANDAQESYSWHVKISDGMLTAWPVGDETQKMTVVLASTYNGGYVSYFTAANGQGGLQGFKVRELEAAATEQEDNTAVIDGDVINVKAGEGYELKAGSLIVTDSEGNKFVPERVGYREGGNAAQYNIPEEAVGECTVAYEFIQPGDANGYNLGFLGTSVHTEDSALRFVYRLNIDKDGKVLYNGQKVAVKEYGLLLASAAILPNAADLDIETAADSMHVHQFAWPTSGKFYDKCDDYVDIAVQVNNIPTAAANVNLHSRVYLILENDAVVYMDAVTANYANAK